MKLKTTKVVLAATMLMIATMASAVPAKRGLWRQIKLSDGTKVYAELRGDENCHFLADRQGNAYVMNENGTYDIAEPAEVSAKIMKSKQDIELLSNADLKSTVKRSARKKAQGIPTDLSIYQGTRKGLVILAQFKDVAFDTQIYQDRGYSSLVDMYKDIVNGDNFKSEPFIGSVRDYFRDQSHGQFILDFDVVGPVTVSQNRAYYGGNLYTRSSSGGGHGGSSSSSYTDADIGDGHASYMIYEAIQKAYATGEVNFSDYDWDGDGECEFVYVIYAGQGEADGGDESTIWPHKFTISSGASNESYYSRYGTYYYKDEDGNYSKWSSLSYSSLNYNSTKIDTYACSNELATLQEYDSSSSSYVTTGTQLNGIGTICHEFSHCMGYPDMYDTGYSYSGPQMGHWDLMCSGSYNGSWNGVDGGYCPAGYTTFERWTVGWDEPIVLDDPTKISFLKPIGGTPNGGVDDYGKGYVVYMPSSTQANTGEYYMLENRQNANWDYGLPWFGLLIYYVQYGSSLWSGNTLNTPSSAGHEHMSVFEAFGWDYLGWYNFDAYPWKVSYLPQLFSSSASFYDEDGATMAKNMNDYFGNITVQSGSSTTYADYVGFYTHDNNALTDSSEPSAYYYGSSGLTSSSSSSRTLKDHEIWNIQYNGDNDRTVSFNYRYPDDSKTLSLDQTTTEEEEIATGYYKTISTNKNVEANTWNTIWLPFDLNKFELREVFGDSVKLAKFTGTAETDGETTLEFEDCTSDGLHAYTPYLIKVDEAISDAGTFDSIAVYTANADATIELTTEDGWKMVGAKTYDTIAEGNVFIANGEYWTSKGASKLKAYRCYFVPATSSNAKKMAKVSRLSIKKPKAETNIFEGHQINPEDPNSSYFDPNLMLLSGNTTGITVQDVQRQSLKDGKVYNMSGQRVADANAMGMLRPGIYIVNGKKVIIK